MNICEQRFMSKADSFSVTERDLQAVLQRMNDWFAELLQTLDANCLKSHGLQPGSALARQARAIVADVKASRCRWAKQWTELHPAQSLAQSFEDKVMLLVFGKFKIHGLCLLVSRARFARRWCAAPRCCRRRWWSCAD